MPLLGWHLKIDDRGPGRAGFAVEGGRCEEVYVSDAPVTFEEVRVAMVTILGDSAIGTNKLARVVPLAHPVYPWMFATQVDVEMFGNVDADGNVITQVAADTELESPPIVTGHVQHVRAELRIQFAPRPYPVLQDASIGPATTLTYYDDGGNAAASIDSKEYLRFTDHSCDPNPQTVYAQQGLMVYRSSVFLAPHGYAFSGFPRTTLPDGTFQLTWYQVPYRITEDPAHPMWAYVGKINQTTFFRRPPGALLYMGPKFRRYTPVVPANVIVDGGVSFSSEKLCDITFLFLYTTRQVTSPPTPTNLNHVAAGWNAQPYWRERAFFYVTDADTAEPPNIPATGPGTDKTPTFKSAPMQLLFRVP